MKKIYFLSVFVLYSIVLLSQNRAVFLNESTLWADSVLKTMSPQERIAQLFMVAAYSNKDDSHKKDIINLVEKYKIGGVMFLQGGPVRQAKFTNDIQNKSKVPLMIAIDAEWGVAMRLDSCHRFPWQMTLGAIEDNELIYRMGAEVARQCKILGIHINFAPVVDVNSNPRNPIINNRSFGENPFRVSDFGIAYMNGMQDNNVLACAKHFPGHGDTDKDSHKTLPTINHKRDRFDEVELIPFKNLINKGLGSVMIAHLKVPAFDDEKNLSTSLSNKVVNELLKQDLGFTGLAITDALNMKGVSDYYEPGNVDLKALLAGNDVLLFSQDVPKAIEIIKKAIKENKITQNEIDLRCHKILMAKKWLGLNKYKNADLSIVKEEIISRETKSLDSELILSSLTLLKNDDDILPIKQLDDLQIAVLCIGENNNEFQTIIKNYVNADFFNVSESPSLIERSIVLNKLSSYDLVITSIHKSNENAWKSYKISNNTDLLLQALSARKDVILSIFANPYSINSLSSIRNINAILLGYQNSKIAQNKIAQAIFGGVIVKGKIPVTTKHFELNTGLLINKVRLGYKDFYETNFDTCMIYKIDSIVKNAIKKRAIPGCQILIAKDGDVFFNKPYGFHTYVNENPVKKTDLYDIASITKIASTAPILMQMVDNEKLDLDDVLGNYLDLDSSAKKNLIIREILAHQSGLFPWIPFYKTTLDFDSISRLFSLRDTLYDDKYSSQFPFKVANSIYLHFSYEDSIIKRIIDSELLENKKYAYSDLGYYLFNELIEKYYIKSLDSVIYNEFLDKLGMYNTRYNAYKYFDLNRIVPTENDTIFRKQIIDGYVHDMGAAMQGGIGGHAGLFSNANDLAKMMQMYLQKGVYGGEYFLSKEVIKDFTRCQFPEEENRRGAAFDKPALKDQEGGPASQNASLNSFGHSGFTGTLAWVDPDTKIIYVFLSNRIYPDANNTKLLDMNVRTDIMEVIFDFVND